MSKQNGTCTGFDIGSNSLKIVACEGGTITKTVIEPLPEGLMSEGHLVSIDATADFIKETVAAAGHRFPRNAALAIPADESLIRRLSLPAMTDKELALNLPFEFRDYISQGKDHFYYDYALLNMETDESGNPESMELLAAAALKQRMDDYSSIFRRAGFHLACAMPPEAALQKLAESYARFKAADTDGETDAFCVIDMAHRATRLHFFANGRYDVTRTIDIGGIDVTKTLSEALNIDLHTAMMHKHSDFEGAQSNAQVMGLYDTIAVDIERALNFYGFNNPETALSAAYLIGAGSLLAPLTQEIGQRLSIPVYPGATLMSSAFSKDNTGNAFVLAAAATLGLR